MLLLIGFVISLVYFTLYNEERSNVKNIRYIFLSCGFFCLLLLEYCSIRSIENPHRVYEYKDYGEENLVSTVEIVCLNDNLVTEGEIKGDMFVTKESTDTGFYYYYMYVTDKRLITERVRAENTTVLIISESEKPYIEKYAVELDKDNLTFFGRMFTLYGLGLEMKTDNFEPEPSLYRLYVHKDSITSNYTIDLK